MTDIKHAALIVTDNDTDNKQLIAVELSKKNGEFYIHDFSVLKTIEAVDTYENHSVKTIPLAEFNRLRAKVLDLGEAELSPLTLDGLKENLMEVAIGLDGCIPLLTATLSSLEILDLERNNFQDAKAEYCKSVAKSLVDVIRHGNEKDALQLIGTISGTTLTLTDVLPHIHSELKRSDSNQ